MASSDSRYARSALIGALVAFLAGSLVLGWYLGTLRRLTPADGFVTMQPSTALGFALTGLAIVAHVGGRRRLARACGAAAVGLGGLALAEHLLGRQLLGAISFGEGLGADAGQPMSPAAALSLALLGGLTLIWSVPGTRAPWRRLASGLMAGGVAAGGVVGLLAPVVAGSSGADWSRLTAMDSNTAIGFLGLGMAFFLLVVRLRRRSERALLPRWAGWTVALTVAVLSLSLWTRHSAREARHATDSALRARRLVAGQSGRVLHDRIRALERVTEQLASVPLEPDPALVAELLAELPGLVALEQVPRQAAAVGDERLPVDALARRALRQRATVVGNPSPRLGDTDELVVAVPAPSGERAWLFVHDLPAFLGWVFGDAGPSVELATGDGQGFYQSGGAGAPPPGPGPRPGAIQLAFGDQLWWLSVLDESGAGAHAGNTLMLWFGLLLAASLGFAVSRSEQLQRRAVNLEEARSTIERQVGSLEQRARVLRETQQQLVREAREKRAVLDSLSAFLIGVDDAGRVVEWNSLASRLLGSTAEQALGRPFIELPLPWDREELATAVAECRENGRPVRRETLALAGTDRLVGVTITPMRTEGFAIIGSDVTERRQLEMQLHHAQRLEAVGTLAAGIAHEINTPIQFVSDNLRFVSQSVAPLTEALALLPELAAQARAGSLDPKLVARLELLVAEHDPEFLASELTAALHETREGVERVTSIVRAMKDFSHPGSRSLRSADLNRALRTTLAVARNEYRYHADVITEFEPLPPVECMVDDLNQVFLNLLINAAHAIQEKVGQGGGRGTIRIGTRVDGDDVEVRFQDDGVGIPPEVRDRVFDQFFTTKDVGRGTGLGLSIARSVVVEGHHGTIRFESRPGEGTTFLVRVPINSRQQAGGPVWATPIGPQLPPSAGR
jgi:PAS domain S-box-containing protein